MTDPSKVEEAPASIADLQLALAQRTALLHEVDHRVKNNLQLIASLLLLQTRRTADPATREALRGMLERVNAVATVHRRLFQSADAQRFDVSEFVRDLVSDVVGATGRGEIRVRLDLQPVSNVTLTPPTGRHLMRAGSIMRRVPSGDGGG